MTITVTGVEVPAGARLRWLSITPWIGARFQVHVSVPGGDGLGRTFDRGSDNRVATITGLVQWNHAGEAVLDAIGGSTVTVDNGAGSAPVEAVADAPVVVGYGGAVVKFTVTLTETGEGGA